ncbi:hypothetical protein J8I29_20340 [Labrys sp. LIt4]|uniref:MaoC-like domain-containing protein n=1 Tax=Labrys okinawensis TaxID=346911 RepID=A0A2S9Q9K0_9HYPH|nr:MULTISPECIES: hypothetical protein [Labrys]MBP0581688.1 hypothetical protein [Labrys sp. LIt4]PRH86029.1 hypothetical protein C5L14_17380 [Labrys okinawensis]
MSAPPPLRIGPIAARVEADAVRRYREATAFDGMTGEGMARDGDEVPATFPAIWLWHPAAKAAFEDLAGEEHLIPVLIAQRFSYRRALRIGEEIRFVITRQADAALPDDVQIEAHIEGSDGEVIADFAATYRLFQPELAQ